MILEVDPQLQQNPDALDQIYVRGAAGAVGAAVGVRALRAQRRPPLSIAHQGQFPAVTLSFNLAPGASLGDAVDAVRRGGRRRWTRRPACAATSRAPRAAFGESLVDRAVPDPGRARHRLHRARRALRELHPPGDDPLDAAVGGRGRVPGADRLSAPSSRVIALIGIVLLIGIVKKNAIMMIDFALEAEREQGMSPREAIHQACLLRFRPIMMTTMAALLGGLPLALGTRHRRRAAPAARHHDRRRPAASRRC